MNKNNDDSENNDLIDIETSHEEEQDFQEKKTVENNELSQGGNLNEESIQNDNDDTVDIENDEQEKEEIPSEEQSDEEMSDIYRNLVEGALYAAGKSLSIEEISTKMNISKVEIEKLLNELLEIYNNRSSAITIIKIGEKYQMQIKSEYSDKISQFAQGGAISEKYLRTLTIIALKQPILKSIVIKIRGSGAYEHIKYLEENGFIVGIKKGRSAELSTTDKYAEMFGLPRDKQEMKKIMVGQLGIDQKS
ncbi:MAG: SMC-Scp complex subunit ScpB [Candidatus Lokiarchaeota archaeon]|nr:SMC-Scp complex subunit ScpB [Candidatus Lokiarchaeota archaeon]